MGAKPHGPNDFPILTQGETGRRFGAVRSRMRFGPAPCHALPMTGGAR